MGTDHDVIVLAATNHPESLDSALTRPGRFDRKIEIPIPDEAARTELFEYYLNRITTAANFEEKAADLRRKVDAQNEALEKKRAAPDAAAKRKELDGVRANIAKLEAAAEPGLSQLQAATRDGVLAKLRKQAETLAGEVGDGEEKWEANLAAPAEADVAAARGLPRELAARTPGVTPASIATIANEAALVAADRGSSFVARADVEDAIDNVLIGKKHRARMSEHGLTRVAYHEAGHAVAQWLMGTQTAVIKVSIIPRGRAGGYTQFRQPEELDPRTDAFLFEQLVVALGGRCAEKLAFGDLSTGAQDDLRRAFDSAQGLVQTFGMSEEVGHIAVNPQGEQRGRAFSSVSEKLKSRIEDQGREIVDRAFERCMALLIENQDKMEALARRLIEKRELGEEEIAQILGPKVVAPQAVAGGQALLASRAAAA